jgi:hypothetical protein
MLRDWIITFKIAIILADLEARKSFCGCGCKVAKPARYYFQNKQRNALYNQ